MQHVISLKEKGTTSGMHSECCAWNSGPSTVRFPQFSSSLGLGGSVPQSQLLGTRHNLGFSVHVKGRFRSGVLAPLTSVTLLFLAVAQPAERSDEVQGLESVYVTTVTALLHKCDITSFCLGVWEEGMGGMETSCRLRGGGVSSSQCQ